MIRFSIDGGARRTPDDLPAPGRGRGPTRSGVGSRSIGWPSKQDRAARRRLEADRSVRIVVVLPAAFGADQRNDLAGAMRSAHVLQDVDSCRSGREAAKLQHAGAPDTPSMTRLIGAAPRPACLRRSSCRSAARSRRSANSARNATLWSMMQSVVPCSRRSRSTSLEGWRSPPGRGPTPARRASRSSGSHIIAMATPSIFSSP